MANWCAFEIIVVFNTIAVAIEMEKETESTKHDVKKAVRMSNWTEGPLFALLVGIEWLPEWDTLKRTDRTVRMVAKEKWAPPKPEDIAKAFKDYYQDIESIHVRFAEMGMSFQGEMVMLPTSDTDEKKKECHKLWKNVKIVQSADPFIFYGDQQEFAEDGAWEAFVASKKKHCQDNKIPYAETLDDGEVYLIFVGSHADLLSISG